MPVADNHATIESIRQQTVKVGGDMRNELLGVTNVAQINDINLKYTEMVVAAVPESIVDQVKELTVGVEQFRLGKHNLSPMHGIVLDELSEELLRLSELAFHGSAGEGFATFVDFLAAEAANIPWFDPDVELWCNRYSEDAEIGLRQSFIDAGRLRDYLDGDTA